MRFYSNINFIRQFALKKLFSRNFNFRYVFKIAKNLKYFENKFLF